MKRALLTTFLFYSLSIQGFSFQQVGIDKRTERKMDSNIQNTIWDVQLSINLSEGTGAEFDGNYFYITNNLSNLINKYDVNGNLVEAFSIPGVSNLGDIAFDGTYMYGGTGSALIFQMDFVTKTLISTINTPVNVRHIAYDDDDDAFWVGSWVDPLVLISRSGTLLNTFNIMLPFITGTAYDNVSAGGPYLWIFDRGNQIPGPQMIHQLHIPSGTFTGITHDVLSDVGAAQPNAVAGGLFSTSDLIQGTFSLGGILIGAPTILFAYELMNPIPVELLSFTASYSDKKIILLWQTASEINNRGFELERKERSIDENWNKIGFISGHGTTTQTNSYTYYDEDISSVNYEYRLKQIDFDGTISFSKIIQIKVPALNKYSLKQNYPNPFNPSTKINFTIPQTGFTSLKVYDVLGNKVATLVNEEKPAGEYEIDFNSNGLTSGIYFYQLRAESFIQTKKMILMK